MRLQAALNGARAAGFHPALPLTAEDAARDAARCVAAGAFGVHLHPRDPATGRETLDARHVGRAVALVRAALPPAATVSVSTGAWIAADDAARRAALAAWADLPAGERPDEASVNLSEADAPAVMDLLSAAGVGVEAGLASLADAERFLALRPAGVRRVLVEIGGEAGAALGIAAAVAARLDAARYDATVPRQMHGEGESVWPLFDLACGLGLEARLGLEDGRLMPGGRVAADNAELVALGVQRAGATAAALARAGRGRAEATAADA